MNIDKQKSMIAFFSMPGTDPEVKAKFMQLSQMKALQELERDFQNNSAQRNIEGSQQRRAPPQFESHQQTQVWETEPGVVNSSTDSHFTAPAINDLLN